MNIKILIGLISLIPIQLFASNDFCLITKENPSNYNNENMHDLDIFISDCKSRNKIVDTFGYFGDNVKNNFYFFQKEKNRLFISMYVYTGIYEENPTYVYSEGKYFFTRVYDCKNLSCKLNDKLTHFFGDGGNILQVSNDKIVRKFPYEKKEDIQNEINSIFFKKWNQGEIKTGVVSNKTFINDIPNYNPNDLGYLIQGDKFTIQDISSKWLNITYTNNKDKITSGWIDCNDTDVCK